MTLKTRLSQLEKKTSPSPGCFNGILYRNESGGIFTVKLDFCDSAEALVATQEQRLREGWKAFPTLLPSEGAVA